MDTRLTKSEFPLLRRLGRDFDWFFDRFGFDRPVFGAAGKWTPYVEVYEQNNEFFVKAELPGLKKQDVNVEVAAGALTISGERREEVEKSESGFYRSERSYGGFLRTIALPAGATIEKAVATMKDGVLEIKMPLANTIETPRRKIDIAEAAPDGNDASNAA